MQVERLQRLCDVVVAQMVAAETVFLLQRDAMMKGSCRGALFLAAGVKALKEAADVM